MAVGSKSVHEAILAVTDAIGKIPKGVEVAGIGGGRDYRVMGIEQIIEAVQPILVQESLSIVPAVSSAKSWDKEIYNQQGAVVGNQHWAQVIVNYKMTGPDGSQEVATMVGESENDNDKSMSAALSLAEKYFYKETFKIVTGDPDPDTVGTKVRDITQPSGAAPVTTRQPSQQQSSSPAPTTGMNEKIANTAGSSPAPAGNLVTKPQAQLIWAVCVKNIGMDEPTMRDYVDQVIGRHIDDNDELTVTEFKKVKAKLEAHPNYTPPAKK
jgi:hypothetical protein